MVKQPRTPTASTEGLCGRHTIALHRALVCANTERARAKLPESFFGVVMNLGLKSWTWSEMLVYSRDGSRVPEFGAGERSLLLCVI
jgi:hypothetical protein